MPASENRPPKGCPHSSASEIGRKTDARVCQHPKIGLRKDARVCQHPKLGEKWMPTYASIQNWAKNGCPRMPASKIGRKMDARVCQHPKIGLRKDARVCWHPFAALFIRRYNSAETSGNLFPLPSVHSGKRIKGSDG